MSWCVSKNKNDRDVGYGVPCICDHPDCNEEIHRGLVHVCGGMHNGGEFGCGLYFCKKYKTNDDQEEICERCSNEKLPFTPKPDTTEWIQWKLTDDSWQRWRDKNPDEVRKLLNDN